MKIRFDLRRFAVDTLYYVAGCVLFSLGLYAFALNGNFSTGGVSGISLIVHHYTGLPLGIIALGVNLPLVILCLRVIGWRYLVKSIYVMLINTFFLDVIFPLLPTYSGNPLLAAMFTGILMGAGMALVFMRGATTGGTDFIIMSVKKLRPHFSVGQISLALDMVVIVSALFVFGNIDSVLYGIITVFACTLAMDNILYGAGSSKMAIIVTNFGAAIADAISCEIARGSTLLQAKGAYTGEGRDMLMCVCGKSEIYKLRTAARAIDPASMVIITEASEVIGEGFTPHPIPGSAEPPPAKKD